MSVIPADIVNTTPVDTAVAQTFEELDYTQVWSVEDINSWVMDNHGGFEWSAIADQHLINDETRSTYAKEIVSGLVE